MLLSYFVRKTSAQRSESASGEEKAFENTGAYVGT